MKSRALKIIAALMFVSVGRLSAAPKTEQDPEKAKKADAKRTRSAGSEYYRVEDIATPPGLSAECGGLAFLADGRLAACFHHGEVYLYTPATKAWKLFAEGLHDPLGILPVSEKEILVMQRPELTRLRDTDGDGVADSYETVCDDFGMTGNYHEFAFGPILDAEGNFVVALNCGSSGAGIRNELRGEFNPHSYLTRMYSAVPYRGWIVKISPAGKLTPWALGFRSPNGLGYDAAGRLFVSDNQGDWLGACPLYHVEKGKFYGHPASLVWNGETRDTPTIPVAELDAKRTRGAIIFPYNTVANSPTQPLLDSTKGKFGPFAGQMLIGEMNRPKIIRMMFDEVDGQLQGACAPLIDGAPLRKGNNRLAFAPDGSLWVGQTDHGWAGDKGIQRIVWTGKVPLEVSQMKLTTKGFTLDFTLPLDAQARPELFKIKRYYYEYHSAYGSKQYSLEDVPVTTVSLSPDRKRATVELADLKAWRIYELHLDGLKAADGTPIFNPLVAYTLNHLLENTPEPPPPGISTKASDVE